MLAKRGFEFEAERRTREALVLPQVDGFDAEALSPFLDAIRAGTAGTDG